MQYYPPKIQVSSLTTCTSRMHKDLARQLIKFWDTNLWHPNVSIHPNSAFQIFPLYFSRQYQSPRRLKRRDTTVSPVKNKTLNSNFSLFPFLFKVTQALKNKGVDCCPRGLLSTPTACQWTRTLQPRSCLRFKMLFRGINFAIFSNTS